jgi:hypothetical protein
MRKYLLLAIFGGSLLTSCDDKTPDPGPTPIPEPNVAFTITSENFDNFRMLVSDDSKEEGAYEPAPNPPIEPNTQPLVLGLTKDGKYLISISGQWDFQPGETYPKTVFFSDKHYMTIEITGKKPETDTISISMGSKPNEGSVTIDKYGSVGGYIEGSFKGIFSTGGGLDATIKEGKFKLKRGENL